MVGVGHSVKEMCLQIVLFWGQTAIYGPTSCLLTENLPIYIGCLCQRIREARLRLTRLSEDLRSKIKVSMTTGMARRHLESRTIYIHHTQALVHS